MSPNFLNKDVGSDELKVNDESSARMNRNIYEYKQRTISTPTKAYLTYQNSGQGENGIEVTPAFKQAY